MTSLTPEEADLLAVNRTQRRWSLIPYELVTRLYPALMVNDESIDTYVPLIVAAHKSGFNYHSGNLSQTQDCLKEVFELLRDILYTITIESADISFEFSPQSNSSFMAVEAIVEVMTYGAAKYGVNSWRTLPIDAHIDHMIQHIYYHIIGDDSEPNIEHALCRCAFAISLLSANYE